MNIIQGDRQFHSKLYTVFLDTNELLNKIDSYDVHINKRTGVPEYTFTDDEKFFLKGAYLYYDRIRDSERDKFPQTICGSIMAALENVAYYGGHLKEQHPVIMKKLTEYCNVKTNQQIKRDIIRRKIREDIREKKNERLCGKSHSNFLWGTGMLAPEPVYTFTTYSNEAVNPMPLAAEISRSIEALERELMNDNDMQNVRPNNNGERCDIVQDMSDEDAP